MRASSPLITAVLPRIAADEARRVESGRQTTMDIVFIEGLEIETIIGIKDWERTTRQTVRLDIEMASDIMPGATSEDIAHALDYQAVTDRLRDFVATSEFQLVETLAERVAAIVMTEFAVPWLRLRLSKPTAIPQAKAVGVVIERGALT